MCAGSSSRTLFHVFWSCGMNQFHVRRRGARRNESPHFPFDCSSITKPLGLAQAFVCLDKSTRCGSVRHKSPERSHASVTLAW